MRSYLCCSPDLSNPICKMRRENDHHRHLSLLTQLWDITDSNHGMKIVLRRAKFYLDCISYLRITQNSLDFQIKALKLDGARSGITSLVTFNVYIGELAASGSQRMDGIKNKKNPAWRRSVFEGRCSSITFHSQLLNNSLKRPVQTSFGSVPSKSRRGGGDVSMKNLEVH